MSPGVVIKLLLLIWKLAVCWSNDSHPRRQLTATDVSMSTKAALAAEVQRCNTSYTFLQRSFFPPTALYRDPVLLLSHQGSGNTWTRLLLEYSTGIYTGSVYSDTTLYDILPAEAECGRIMLVNRAHPGLPYPNHDILHPNLDWYITQSLPCLPFPNQLNPDVVGNQFIYIQLDVCKISPGPGGYIYPRDKQWITIHFSGYRRKCHRGQIYGFKRFIIVLRDPFRAMWAEYQRVNTRGVHNTGIELVDWRQDWWEDKLVNEIAPNFALHWRRIYQRIFQMWPNDYMLVQYEHLLDRKKRYQVMQSMIKFLNMTVSPDRLKCSFAFADRPSAHRHIDKNKMVTIDQVYKNTTIVCQVWDYIRNLTEFPSYGYIPWKGIHCPLRTNPEPIIPCHMVPRLIGFDVTSSKVLTERDFNCSSSSSTSSSSNRNSKVGS